MKTKVLTTIVTCALLIPLTGCISRNSENSPFTSDHSTTNIEASSAETAMKEPSAGPAASEDTAEKETLQVPKEKAPDVESEPVQSEPEKPSEPSPPPPALQESPMERSEPAPPQPPPQPPSQPPVPVTPEPAAPEPEPVEPVPAEPEPEEPAPSEPEPTEPAFDIDYWISYAKSYASGIGLNLNSEAVYCWDNPIIAGSGSKYLERDIQGMLNKYNRDEEITDVWVWATPRADGNYDLFIGYA